MLISLPLLAFCTPLAHPSPAFRRTFTVLLSTLPSLPLLSVACTSREIKFNTSFISSPRLPLLSIIDNIFSVSYFACCECASLPRPFLYLGRCRRGLFGKPILLPLLCDPSNAAFRGFEFYKYTAPSPAPATARTARAPPTNGTSSSGRNVNLENNSEVWLFQLRTRTPTFDTVPNNQASVTQRNRQSRDKSCGGAYLTSPASTSVRIAQLPACRITALVLDIANSGPSAFMQQTVPLVIRIR